MGHGIAESRICGAVKFSQGQLKGKKQFIFGGTLISKKTTRWPWSGKHYSMLWQSRVNLVWLISINPLEPSGRNLDHLRASTHFFQILDISLSTLRNRDAK
jgi:hypothetical protein